MEQYISKDALIAELKKRIKVSQDYAKCNLTEKTRIGNHAQQLELNDILAFLDTLEVKEEDLDKECRKYLTEYFNVYEDEILQSKRSGMPLDTFDVIQVARHFFELGIKAKGE